MPEGLDMHNREALRAWMETLPASVYLVVLAGYVIGALDGSIVATIISGRSALRPAITVGVVLTLASLANVLMIPQPAWFVGASLCIPLPVAYLGYRIARKKPVVI
jgi:hypothetical protein